MNKRFLLNISLTAAILSVAGTVYVSFQSAHPGKESLIASEAEAGSRVRLLLGDENLEVPDCVVEYNQDGFRHKMQAKYPDGAQVTASYDSFGRVKQAVEMGSDGYSQVYEFDPRTQKPKELKFLDRDGCIEKKVVFGKGWRKTSEYDTVGGLSREEILFSNGRFQGKTVTGHYGGGIQWLSSGEYLHYSGVGNRIDQVSLLHDKSSAVEITAKRIAENLFAAEHNDKQGHLRSKAKIQIFQRKDGWDLGYWDGGVDAIEVVRNLNGHPWLICKEGALAEKGARKLRFASTVTEYDYTGGLPLRQYKFLSGFLTVFGANGSLERRHLGRDFEIICTENVAGNGDVIDVKPDYRWLAVEPAMKELLSLFHDSVGAYFTLRQVLPDVLELEPIENELRLLNLPLTE